jgi:5-methylcytosine-specific restriction endonuclease McrA
MSIVHVAFYPSDWLAGTRGLSAEETGVYITLIARIYEMAGPIPRDDNRLSRLCGCASKAKFSKALEYLMSEGKIIERDGYLTSDLVGRWKAFYRKEAARPPIPTDMRDYVFKRDGQCCVYCGSEEGPFELDHVTPWSRGGDHEVDNLVVSCRSCNRQKADRTPIEMGWLI